MHMSQIKTLLLSSMKHSSPCGGSSPGQQPRYPWTLCAPFPGIPAHGCQPERLAGCRSGWSPQLPTAMMQLGQAQPQTNQKSPSPTHPPLCQVPKNQQSGAEVYPEFEQQPLQIFKEGLQRHTSHADVVQRLLTAYVVADEDRLKKRLHSTTLQHSQPLVPDIKGDRHWGPPTPSDDKTDCHGVS